MHDYVNFADERIRAINVGSVNHNLGGVRRQRRLTVCAALRQNLPTGLRKRSCYRGTQAPIATQNQYFFHILLSECVPQCGAMESILGTIELLHNSIVAHI